MTLEAMPRPAGAPSVGLHQSAVALRRTLLTMVQRRVPRTDAEDIVQATLCDALAAPAPPGEPTAFARWVIGIARHKIADFHRAARRAPEALVVEAADAPVCFETREALRAIAASSAADPRGRETLEWILRESAGESLRAIAAAERVGEPVVRQRVSRLRRRLRAQWLLPAVACGVVLLALLALRHGVLFGSRAPALVAEPLRPPRTIAEASVRIEGRWRVSAVEPARPLDLAHRVLVRAETPLVRVEIRGEHLSVHGPALHIERDFKLVALEGSDLRATLRGRDGAAEELTVRLATDGTLTVSAPAGYFAGRARLSR